MDECEESTARIRVAWVTADTADFESGPGDYHYEHADFSELDRLLAARDRVVAATAWDGALDQAVTEGWMAPEGAAEMKEMGLNPYRITEENN